MGILYYFIGWIPIAILTFIFNYIIEKIHIKEKIENFDKSNAGPIYDFFKSIFFVIIIILGILSLGVIILPIYVYLAFENGNILQGLFLTLIGSIVFSVYCNINN